VPLALKHRRHLTRWASWLGNWVVRQEAVVLGALLAAAAGVWLFVKIAGEVLEGDSQRLDTTFLQWLRDPADASKPLGPHWLAEGALEITSLGSTAVLLLVIGGVLGYLAIRRLWGAFWLVLAAALGGQLLNSVLKASFGRQRPTVVPHLTDVQTLSFPSGHAMLSAIIYLTLGALLVRLEEKRRVKLYILLVAVTLTLLVGITRVYLGVHYPTDVLAGWVAGMVWAILCWLAARWLQRRGKVEQSLERPAVQKA
jgi:undecaprenyl-diphosphatase